MPNDDPKTTTSAAGHVCSTEGLGHYSGARRLAEAIDPLRRKAAPDHLTIGCAAQMLEVQAAEIERLRAALAELVAVKDLKERTEALHFAGPSGTAGDGWKDLYEAGRRDYLRRQPAAWDAARDVLGPNVISTNTD